MWKLIKQKRNGFKEQWLVIQPTDKDVYLGREKIPISSVISIKYSKITTVSTKERDLNPCPG